MAAIARTTSSRSAGARISRIGLAIGIASQAGSFFDGESGMCASSTGRTPGKSPIRSSVSISCLKRRYGSALDLPARTFNATSASPSSRTAR